ncbi:MAG: anhydro-N-acetylmuramic acid kinase [Bdellovibrionales bacterium]
MNRLEGLAKFPMKTKSYVIGLMSGMSIDGVDLAFVSISGHFPDLEVKLLKSYFRPYNKGLQKRLQDAQNANAEEISKLNFVVAREFSDCVNEFLANESIAVSQVDLIGSHGQTLYHSSDLGETTPSSLQVGSPSIIAELTGIPTVGNFRVRDMVAGGQGAPLVCLADYILFRNSQGPVILNNLGSISNVSVVTDDIEQMLAFDTGPANMAIDFFARKVPGNDLGIDRDGSISKIGKVIPALLNDLLAIDFFNRVPPKAAGYTEFGPVLLEALSKKHFSEAPEDLVRTAVEFSAVSIEQAYRKYVLPRFSKPLRVLFSGGGIHNQTLMQQIQLRLPELKIESLESEFADSKEAVSFAILAHQTICGNAGNVTAATGAKRPVVLGEIAV